ncbi:hypothetical protein SH668x_001024 [Planctomicrobium sp. SH668]|uniref:hypothetical protein n=1 Tax=Planctomicrobium sp. SH668 TaxID=3448126 RepID=UPI003F5C3F6C
MCGNSRLSVSETRSRPTRIWRTRKCLACGGSFKTCEEFREFKPVDGDRPTYSVQH